MSEMPQQVCLSTSNGYVRTSISIEAEKLGIRIERAIRLKTGDRIRDLNVLVDATGVHLCGRAATFYRTQLAQTAASQLAQELPVFNRIEVE
jgi:hypothetical protein